MRGFAVAVLLLAWTAARADPSPAPYLPAPSRQAPLGAAPSRQAPLGAAPSRQAPLGAAPSRQAPPGVEPSRQAPLGGEPPSPPVGWSVAAGMATGLVSLAIGGALMATDNHHDMEAGTYVMMTGLALAPAVSHLVSREWGRSAIFGAIPTAALIGMTALLEVHPAVLYEGNKDPTRITFAVLVAGAVVSSAGGIVDSLWAGERARKRRLTLAPVMSRDRYGLALGGDF